MWDRLLLLLFLLVCKCSEALKFLVGMKSPGSDEVMEREVQFHLGTDPASSVAKHRPVNRTAHAAFAAGIRDVPPERR